MRDESANVAGLGGRRPADHDAHNIAIVLYEGFTAFELGVVCEVFGDDRWVAPGQPWYRLFICAEGARPVTSDSGFQVLAPHGLEVLERVDTVIVAPTYQPHEVPQTVMDSLREAHRRGCRLLSLCAGAFVLAAAGLLEGRRAATHWAECDELARRFPNLTVDPDVLFVDEGDILTGAGSAASIDVCLHIVREDFGSEMATQLARQLVVPPQRQGDQAQFIETPLPQLDEMDLLSDTLTWIESHLEERISVQDLAGRTAMSPRTFARRFRATTGTTPNRWLQAQRVKLAQRLLETSDIPIEIIAVECGFSTAGNLRKHFGQLLHTSPQAYRHSFRHHASDRATRNTG